VAIGRPVRDTEADPFYDMLFNMLIAFVFCFVIAILAFNPNARKAGDVPAKAEFMVTVSWPDNNPNDIDTWVTEPGGKTLWFRQRDAGMLHLDRDDRGAKNNSVLVNGKLITSAIRQEIVTLRGIVPGEYVDVSVMVVKVNPQAEIVYTGTQQIPRKGDERTLVRFALDEAGQVLSLSTAPKTIVQRAGL
jgi:hypothetical protein